MQEHMGTTPCVPYQLYGLTEDEIKIIEES